MARRDRSIFRRDAPRGRWPGTCSLVDLMRTRARLLLAVDRSPGATGLAELCARVARAIDAEMTLLNVIRVPEELAEVERAALEHVEVAAARATAAAMAADLAEIVAIDVVVEVSSSAARTIVEHTRRGEFDMVVLGKRAYAPGRAAASATVDYVIRHAWCPVLTMPMSAR